MLKRRNELSTIGESLNVDGCGLICGAVAHFYSGPFGFATFLGAWVRLHPDRTGVNGNCRDFLSERERAADA